MIYPASRHGIFGPHYNRLQLDFIRRTLGAGTAHVTRRSARGTRRVAKTRVSESENEQMPAVGDAGVVRAGSEAIKKDYQPREKR